jgi:hypothetical protein
VSGIDYDGSHDSACESEFIEGPNCAGPCRCEARHTLRIAAWGVIDAPGFTDRYRTWYGRLHGALVELGIPNPFESDPAPPMSC